MERSYLSRHKLYCMCAECVGTRPEITYAVNLPLLPPVSRKRRLLRSLPASGSSFNSHSVSCLLLKICNGRLFPHGLSYLFC